MSVCVHHFLSDEQEEQKYYTLDFSSQKQQHSGSEGDVG
jgi:hypothetical protein